MIFVTLGTQDKSFVRLLEELERLKKANKIEQDIIVQSGYTKFNSKYMTIFDFLSMEDFDAYIKKSDILITHGGVGSILTGIKNDKKIIAIPRLKKYKEHTNDHQLQIIKKFNSKKYVIGINEVDEVENALKKINGFKPKKFIFDNSKMKKIITEYIDNH